MPEEENNIILTQKIRNPIAENEWIDIFQIDKDKNILSKAIVNKNNFVDGSVTINAMYQGDNDDLKPVNENTIKPKSIQNAAMYQGAEDNLRPVSTDTIQQEAIVDEKISNDTITLRKLGEPLAFEDELPLYDDSYRQHYADDYRNYKITFYSTQTKKENAWEK